MLDARTDKAVGQIAEAVRTAFGPGLISLILYGSAAGDDFVPGVSDINIAIVLEEITVARLRTVRQHLPAWQKLGMGMPLLLDRDFLTRGRDVFPMELLDMKAQHRVLHGADVIAALSVDARHLRYQSEHEARSKLLRLRAFYASTGADAERLKGLLIDSVKTFVVIMRSFLRLRSNSAPVEYLRVVEVFSETFGAPFPTMQLLIRIRAGKATWAQDVDDVFAVYLEEVERLVQMIDQFRPDSDLQPVAEQP